MSAPSGRWKAAVMGVSMAPGLMLLTRSAGAGVLDGQGPGEGEHPALGGGVGRGPGLALVGGGRGQVDDVAAAGQQVGEGLAADQEGAGEVDGDQPVPLVQRLLVGVGEREHAGHVDHHVECAQPVDGPADQVARRRLRSSRRRPGRTATRAVPRGVRSASSASSSALTSTATTAAPSAASRRAVARPMPDAAPVTRRVPSVEAFWEHGQTVGRGSR